MTYFIVNPASGNGKAAAAVPIIEKAARDNGKAYTFIHTEKSGDTDRVAGLIDMDAAAAIICVGGDGTAQEYAGLAVGRKIRFGVVPAGSANDMLLSVPVPGGSGGVKKFRSFDERIAYYADRAFIGETVDIDAVSVNGRHYFMNIGGTGVDIQVLKDAQPIKKYFGGAAYFISLIKNAVTYSASEMTLTVDGKAETDRYLIIAVCNGGYYGGNLRIAPPAVINDGSITLCKITKMARPKVAAIFPSVKPGWHTGFKEVSFVNCLRVKVEFEGKKTINLDGNLSDYDSPVTFEIMKSAVKFIV